MAALYNSLPSVGQPRKSFSELRETEYSPESFIEVLDIIDCCLKPNHCMWLFEINFIHLYFKIYCTVNDCIFCRRLILFWNSFLRRSGAVPY